MASTTHDSRLAQIVDHIGTLRIKGQQAHAMTERRGYDSSIGRKAQFFDVTPTNIRFLRTTRNINQFHQFLSLLKERFLDFFGILWDSLAILGGYLYAFFEYSGKIFHEFKMHNCLLLIISLKVIKAPLLK